MKKTILIIGIAVIGIAIVFMVMFFSSLNNGASPDKKSGNIFDAIFPFGNSNQDGGATQGTDTNTPIIDEKPVPRLRLISEKPTSGGAPFVIDEETPVLIRYMDRETGHVYETSADTSTVHRISNTTIPGVQEMVWINQDETLVRILAGNEIENFYIRLPATTTEQSVTGVFLNTWERVALNPKANSLVTISEVDGVTRVTSLKPSGGTEKALFSSPLHSWVPLQTNTNVLMQTAPASGLPGYLYKISNGNLLKIIGGISGLVANPNPKGDLILYSTGQQGFASLNIFNTTKNETTRIPFSSIATKCVWLPEGVAVLCGVPQAFPTGAYPNAWLQGLVSFSDELWIFDTQTGETTQLSDISKEYDVSLDVWQPALSEDGSYLTFINKKDLSFWGFQVIEREEGS